MSAERESTKVWIIPGLARPGAVFDGVIQVTDGASRFDVHPSLAYAAAGAAYLESLNPPPGIPDLSDVEVEADWQRLKIRMVVEKLRGVE